MGRAPPRGGGMQTKQFISPLLVLDRTSPYNSHTATSVAPASIAVSLFKDLEHTSGAGLHHSNATQTREAAASQA